MTDGMCVCVRLMVCPPSLDDENDGLRRAALTLPLVSALDVADALPSTNIVLPALVCQDRTRRGTRHSPATWPPSVSPVKA